MAERFDQLYGDLAEAEQHTKERLKSYYDRLAEEAAMKSEKDSGLYDEVKEEIKSLKKSSAQFLHLFQRTSSASDELEVRLKDTVKSIKRRKLLPPAPANAAIDFEEKKMIHFASGINFYKLFLICFAGSFIGVVIELLWCLFQNGYIESRSGLVWGPFNLLYGIGAVCLSATLYRYRKRSSVYSFAGAFVIGSVVEYACSWWQETFFGTRSWDYSSLPFNINGRICLLYSVFWGILGVFWIKNIFPRLSKWILRIPNKAGKIMTWCLAVFLLVNSIVSLGASLRWSERQSGEPASNFIEEVLDERFPDERMEKIYANAKFIED